MTHFLSVESVSMLFGLRERKEWFSLCLLDISGGNCREQIECNPWGPLRFNPRKAYTDGHWRAEAGALAFGSLMDYTPIVKSQEV